MTGESQKIGDLMLHIGFSGTRVGMTESQLFRMGREIWARIPTTGLTVFHHGDCVGADRQFNYAAMELPRTRLRIVAHPGPPSGWSARCDVDERRPCKPYMVRNRDIVSESHIMIAAPYEREPQPRGGTWGTIAIARQALAAGRLRELVVVGRDGELLDHTRWP